MADHFDALVDFFDRFAQTGWDARLQADFLDFCAPRPEWACLEVGCGPGRLTLRCAAACRRVVGVDRSPAMVARARRNAADAGRGNAIFRQGNILALPAGLSGFDLAYAVRLIFLLEQPALGVAALSRAVRPGGTVAWLNPSEQLSPTSAAAFCDRLDITGFDRECLLGWSQVATAHPPQTEGLMRSLLAEAGLVEPRIAPALDGLARLVAGRRPDAAA